MASDRREIPSLEGVHGHLERELIDQFLRSQGYGRADLAKLPDEQRQNLLKDASTFRKFYDGPDIGRHRYVNARNESGVRAEPAGRGRPPVSLIKERLDSLQTSAIQRDLGLDVS